MVEKNNKKTNFVCFLSMKQSRTPLPRGFFFYTFYLCTVMYYLSPPTDKYILVYQIIIKSCGVLTDS